jgi:hypothetical protein
LRSRVSPFALAFAIFADVLASADANGVEPVFADTDGPSGGAVRGADIFWTGSAGFPSLPDDAMLDLSLAAALTAAFLTFVPRTGDTGFFLSVVGNFSPVGSFFAGRRVFPAAPSDDRLNVLGCYAGRQLF